MKSPRAASRPASRPVRAPLIRTSLLAICLAAGSSLGFVQAQTITSAVPGFITYQGKVSNANGTLVGAGTPVNRTVIFRIWSHQSNGTATDLVYSEQQTVTISEGEFSVLIGQGSALSATPLGYSESAKGPPATTVASAAVFGGATRFLGVTIDDPATAADPEISPRQQLVTSAYAFRAKYAETVGANGANSLTALDNGNVGIGTGNPGAKLEVTGSIRAGGAGTPTSALSLLANSATTQAMSIGYSSSIGTYSSDAAAGDTVMRTENGGKLLFQTGVGASALTIGANNTVGIGTTNPGSLLTIGGPVGTISGISFTPATAGAAGSVTASRYIGLTNAVIPSIAANSGFSGVEFGPPGGADEGFLAFHTHDAGVASGERMRIDKSGNVGIGTSSPGAASGPWAKARLSVDGNILLKGEGGGNSWANQRLLYGGDGTGYALTIGSLNNAGTLNAPVMTLLDNGSVGIGGSPPYSSVRLSVNSPNTSTSTGLFRFNNNAATDSWIHYGGTGDIYWRSGATNGKVVLQDTGGNVGIGTSNPHRGRLEVVGAVGYTSGGYAYLNRNGAAVANATITADYSIWADNRIAAVEFNALSDERTKVLTGRSDGASDLAKLLQIEITDYRFKDTVAHKNREHKKVVAQQVEKVLPQAVSMSTDTVPDIFAVAKVNGDWLELVTDLKPGDRVKLITDDSAHVHEVVEVAADRFRTTLTPKGEKVFVYGREVKDFRSVDYDAISMLNVSATQELKRQNDVLAARVAELEAKDRTRDAKLAAIEKLLQTAQTVMARPAATNANSQD